MKRAVAIGLLLLGALSLRPEPAQAHPLGNFTVSRASALLVLPSLVRLTYVVDMAEIPTFQELATIDGNADDEVTAEELGAWADRLAAGIAPDLFLTVDGHRADLRVTGAQATLVAGQAGLDTLRFESTFEAAVASTGTLVYEDRTKDARIGWREVSASGEGVVLADLTVPSRSPSDLLRSYPTDALQSALEVTAMRASYRPGDGTAAADVAGGSGRLGTESAPFLGVLRNRGLPLMLLGLVIAVAFGAWHALLPGHGKTLMAAAMVGGGAGVRQAVAVAGAVALMHTASVLVLGLAVLGLEATFRPEQLYPWLGVASGLAAIGIGVALLRSRIRGWKHAHDHEHDHAHGHEHGHEHGLPRRRDGRLGARGLLTLAFAGGILPAPSALLVMLAAIQAHRAAYGIFLVLAFSAGLAMSLLGVGVGALRAGDALASRASSRVAIAVPIASAAAIVLVGGLVAVRSFTAM